MIKKIAKNCNRLLCAMPSSFASLVNDIRKWISNKWISNSSMCRITSCRALEFNFEYIRN